MCLKQINQRLVSQILSFVKHKQSHDLQSSLAKQWKFEVNKDVSNKEMGGRGLI